MAGPETRTTRRVSAVAALAAVVAAVLGALSGCGGTGSPGSAAPGDAAGDTSGGGGGARDGVGGADASGRPTVWISAPEEGAFVRNVVVVLAHPWDDEGVEKVELSVDGALEESLRAAPFRFSWNSLHAPDGPHTFSVVAFDAGGRTAQDEVTVTVDNTAPTLVIVAPGEGERFADELPIRVEAEDAFGLAAWDVTLDGVALELPAEGPPLVAARDVTALASGAHVLRARATDPAGNISRDERGFTLDRPPSVTILSPADGAIVDGPTRLSVAAVDDGALARLELFVDGELHGPFFDQSSYDWVPPYARGAHSLEVVAEDGGGQTASRAISVLVDHPLDVRLLYCPPLQVCGEPIGVPQIYGEVRLYVEAHDDSGEIAQVELFVDDSSIDVSRKEPFEFVWDTTSVADGTRVVRAVATNDEGPTGEAVSRFRVANCDRDRDGYLATTPLCGGDDCDDLDDRVHPGAVDQVGDDVDQNCDGVDGEDGDGDGHASESSGGDDCDDEDFSKNPCADDLPGDTVDANCDEADELSCEDCERCTTDAFDGEQCTHETIPEGGGCDDGDPCTSDETCVDGACGGGGRTNCSDGEVCTIDRCDSRIGCTHEAIPDGRPCPGGFCYAGVCEPPG